MPLVNPGKLAPPFDLADQHGHRHALGDYAGRIVVLFFYPMDETVDCTKEACQFRDLRTDFAKAGASVLGISPDDPASHARFAAAHDLRFTLLADSDLDRRDRPRVSYAYGVWVEKTVFGRKVMGLARTTYLIDPKGRVVRRWNRVRVPGHATDVLEAVRRLHAGEPLNGQEVKPLKKRKLARKKTRTHDSDPPFAPRRGPRARGQMVRAHGRTGK